MQSLNGKNVIVAGGAGFIGSNLSHFLVEKGANVIVYDNCSTGKYDYIKDLEGKNGFKFIKQDLLDKDSFNKAVKESEADVIIHLVANPDIRKGYSNTKLDLEQGILTTYNVLESARLFNVKSIIFASSSAVYGNAAVLPTPETYGPLLPISLYGSAKLASEALISSFSNLYGIDYYIFRFANVVGNRQTHGAIIDFVNKLKANPNELEVLGDGKQKKAYIDVMDCIDAMLFVFQNSTSRSNLYNISTDEQTSVAEIANKVIEKMRVKANIKYTNTKEGWPGDITNSFISNEKLKSLGWRPHMNSMQAIEHAIDLAIGASK
ncbi:MAG: NAD-dependent epimerase/dehydratase family protein [Candidatus Micrarchaeaceae archaeon]